MQHLSLLLFVCLFSGLFFWPKKCVRQLARFPRNVIVANKPWKRDDFPPFSRKKKDGWLNQVLETWSAHVEIYIFDYLCPCVLKTPRKVGNGLNEYTTWRNFRENMIRDHTSISLRSSWTHWQPNRNPNDIKPLIFLWSACAKSCLSQQTS